MQSIETFLLLEPIAGDDQQLRVMFVWRGEADRVAVVGGPAGWNWSNSLMERVDDSDLWRRSYSIPRGLRAVYGFLPDPPEDPAFTPGLWYSIMPDPLNPRRYVFPGDEDDPEWGRDAIRSVLEGPDAPPQPWVETRAEVPAGASEVHRFASRVLENERRVYVYTPPGYDEHGAPYPLLIVFDGFAYAMLAPTPTILDNLIAAGEIAPLVAVMPDSLDQQTRDRELPCHPPFVEFLTEELLPWVRGRWTITSDPARTLVAGSSYGGLASAFAAHVRPDCFGNVISQSGAFWWGADAGRDAEWLTNEIQASEALPVRFWLDVGTLEGAAPNALEANRRLRDVLRAKTCDVHYLEYEGGHDYICWQGTLADALLALAPKPS